MRRKKDRSAKVAFFAAGMVAILVGVSVFTLYSLARSDNNASVISASSEATSTGKLLTRIDSNAEAVVAEPVYEESVPAAEVIASEPETVQEDTGRTVAEVIAAAEVIQEPDAELELNFVTVDDEYTWEDETDTEESAEEVYEVSEAEETYEEEPDDGPYYEETYEEESYDDGPYYEEAYEEESYDESPYYEETYDDYSYEETYYEESYDDYSYDDTWYDDAYAEDQEVEDDGWRYINDEWVYVGTGYDYYYEEPAEDYYEEPAAEVEDDGWRYRDGEWVYVGVGADYYEEADYEETGYYEEADYYEETTEEVEDDGWRYINDEWVYVGVGNDYYYEDTTEEVEDDGWRYIDDEWVYVGIGNDGSYDETGYEEEWTDDTEEEWYDDTSYEEETVSYSSLGQQVVDYAMQFVGVTPYVWAGRSLYSGTDCSGFVNLIYDAFGIYCSPASAAYDGSTFGYIISGDQARAGDIAVYGCGAHVAIYAGNGYVVHCSSPENGTVYWNMNYRSDLSWFLRVID